MAHSQVNSAWLVSVIVKLVPVPESGWLPTMVQPAQTSWVPPAGAGAATELVRMESGGKKWMPAGGAPAP